MLSFRILIYNKYVHRRNIMIKSWIKSRLKERTTWDGIGLIVMGLVAIFAANLAKFAGLIAVVYGAWTLWKKED